MERIHNKNVSCLEADEYLKMMAQLTLKSSENMEQRSLDEPEISSGDANSSIASRADSTSSSADLDDDTSIKTTGFSTGYLAGRFVERDQVPVITVVGMQITGQLGLTSFVGKHMQTYYVRRILSPFEFYLERESDTNSEESSSRQKKMQEYYENQDQQAFKFSIQVSKMMCYAYYDPRSKNWLRVRVHDFDFENDVNRALVYYCETGRQEYILCEDLRQLKTEFRGTWDSVTLKCYLYDVLPISGNMHWAMDAVAFFKEYITDLRLGAVVMKLSQQSVVEDSPDITVDCGVVLTEKLDPEERPDTINWLMVEMGYARSIGIMSCSPRALEIPGFVPSFAIPDKTEESKCEENKEAECGIDLHELHSIATKAMSNSGPDVYVSISHEQPTAPVNNPENYLPYSIRCRLAWIRMSCVVGPSKLFIHTENKKLELKAMEAEILQDCRSAKLPQPELESLSPGSLVTCDMKDPKDTLEDSWCRAVVLKVDLPKEAVVVLMVDYGNIMKVHKSVIYEFPEKYRNIPSFVHRVHLSDIRPNYEFPEWEQAINWHFLKYIISFEKDNPLYYLHLPDNGDDSIVNFIDFDQDLIFNDIENKWVAADLKMENAIENEVINSMRNDPLLISYFCSRPVNIYYEVAVKETKFWEFTNLSEYLLKREYAVLVKPRIDKEKLHEICKDGFGVL